MAAKRSARQTTASRQRKRTQAPALPGWVCGLVGLAFGLFVALGVHLHHEGSPAPASASLDSLFSPDGGAEAQQQAAPADAREKPTFEFYRLLPEQEVAVPDAEPGPTRESLESAPETIPVPTVPATASSGDGRSYLLQAGSFRNHADADRLKASLALLGVQASIQRVSLTGGETWHRVRIGPFSDRQELNGVRQRLQENTVETILLRADG